MILPLGGRKSPREHSGNFSVWVVIPAAMLGFDNDRADKNPARSV
jgi:hypothetical protein